MSARGAALVFTVDGAAGSWRLTVTTTSPADTVWQGDIADAEVAEVGNGLRDTLTGIHDIVRNRLEPTPADAATAVRALVRYGRRVTYGLFQGRPMQRFHDAVAACAPAAGNPREPPRIVEVHTPAGFDYPFELLPWAPVAEQVTDPALRVRALMGMSAIVRRRLRRVGETTGVLANTPSLPVTVFLNPRLAQPESEASYLADLAGLVDLYGPWPGSAALPPRTVMHHLIDPGVPLDGSRPRPPARVLHLACHCRTTAGSTDRHTIDIGGAVGGIALGDLKIEAQELADRPRTGPGPLVFLNACGTSAQVSSQASLTTFFLAQDAVGVVGTLCDIADPVAAHFARAFYESLLRKRGVGEAMYDARWHLMDRHHNPLGLLYTFHGDPDVAVAVSHRGEVLPACRDGGRAQR